MTTVSSILHNVLKISKEEISIELSINSVEQWDSVAHLELMLYLEETYSLVSENREAMDKIVDLLIEKETLDGEEFTNILSEFTTIPNKERTPQLLS